MNYKSVHLTVTAVAIATEISRPATPHWDRKRSSASSKDSFALTEATSNDSEESWWATDISWADLKQTQIERERERNNVRIVKVYRDSDTLNEGMELRRRGDIFAFQRGFYATQTDTHRRANILGTHLISGFNKFVTITPNWTSNLVPISPMAKEDQK